jgi:DNA modification methylase
MSATYLQGDCLEVMKTLPDKSVDCFVCDLPYGCLAKSSLMNNGVKRSNGNNQFDGSTINPQTCAWDIKIDLEKFWTEVKRLAKSDNTPVIHFCNTKFGADLINSNPTWFRYDLVWDKQRGVSFLLANKQPMKSHEMIYVFAKKAPYYKRVDIQTDKGEWELNRINIHNRQYNATREKHSSGGKNGMRCPLSVIQCSKMARDGHPTEKPKELYKWLLERYCPAEGTVLDPTAGSFNCITTAEEMGLKGIGIEKDEGFYKKAVERSKKTTEIISETPENEGDLAGGSEILATPDTRCEDDSKKGDTGVRGNKGTARKRRTKSVQKTE